MGSMNSAELLKQHKAMIYAKAKKTHESVSNLVTVPYDDCLQEAYILFMEAISTYDSDRGTKFSTHLHHRLKKLTRNVLMTNRHSCTYLDKQILTTELNEEIIDKRKRLPVEHLSEEGRKIVYLLFMRSIGFDAGTGKGKKLPGKRTIKDYMYHNYEWPHRKTSVVIEEITDWWNDVISA